MQKKPKNDLIIVRSKSGKGISANRNFKKNEKIIEFHGKLYKGKQLSFSYDEVDDHYVQIGEELYMGPSGGLDDFLNHSCSPNSGLKVAGRKVFLIAIKNIKNGEEITWDYSTTMDEDEWEMDCECGGKKCRKRIRDFKYLPRSLQNKYIKLGVVPLYIIKRGVRHERN